MRYAKGYREAFTLVELLVVMAVITILASLIMPSVGIGMRQAAGVKCRSNLGQMGKGCMMYANQYKLYLPCYGEYAAPIVNGNRVRRNATMLSTHSLVYPYVRDPEIFVCPVDASPQNCQWWLLEHPGLNKSSYMWSEHVMTAACTDFVGTIPLTQYRSPQTLGLVADGWECPNGWTWLTCLPPTVYANSRIDWEHQGSVNFVFADSHCERVAHKDLDKIRSDPR
jgi:prepilin-type N-terminal cleavage/methylation domain-containing protein/prepilin-type processing-associated H-X9-DG protein